MSIVVPIQHASIINTLYFRTKPCVTLDSYLFEVGRPSKNIVAACDSDYHGCLGHFQSSSGSSVRSQMMVHGLMLLVDLSYLTAKQLFFLCHSHFQIYR